MDERYLFRGKRLDNGEWVEGNLIDFTQDSNTAFIFNDICKGMASTLSYGQIVAQSLLVVDVATIGQCTGLIAAKSYRGESEVDRLAFEHDVFWDGDYEDTFVVRWDGVLAAWMADYGDEHAEYLGDTLNKRTSIIGNIHDNPELVE